MDTVSRLPGVLPMRKQYEIYKLILVYSQKMFTKYKETEKELIVSVNVFSLKGKRHVIYKPLKKYIFHIGCVQSKYIYSAFQKYKWQ